MITIDLSELRSSSKLPKYIPSESNHYTCPILEEITGADVMVSPDNLPNPSTEHLIKLHIKSGAKLVQLKFGHDLMGSILDGRYKEAQSRMKLAGANPWQCCMLFVGLAHKDKENDNLLINGQQVYGSKNFKYTHYLRQVSLWNDRGGVFYSLSSPNDLWGWLEMQEGLLEHYKEFPQKEIWPISPVLYNEELEHFDNQDYLTQVWLETQKLVPINDLRMLYTILPGVGKTRASDIWVEYKDIETFLVALNNGDLSKVKGIGKGTIQKVIKFLYGDKKNG